MHGAIAETFGSLLQKIWAPTSTSTSYSPREFKQQLQRFAPQFSGYQQHDSQELVAFLLDGLHEDLNRIIKKPYVEKPDWEGGGDLELVQLANKSWEGYKQRNDSVIVDLFQGQYQSTLVCPQCAKVWYLSTPLTTIKPLFTGFDHLRSFHVSDVAPPSQEKVEALDQIRSLGQRKASYEGTSSLIFPIKFQQSHRFPLK
jgi:ubiquitin C-terminal hydrolase